MTPAPKAVEEAEAKVELTYREMLEHAKDDSRYARAESFRLAVMYRNSLLTTEQLIEMEKQRGLR
jgi:hypothetical protein